MVHRLLGRTSESASSGDSAQAAISQDFVVPCAFTSKVIAAVTQSRNTIHLVYKAYSNFERNYKDILALGNNLAYQGTKAFLLKPIALAHVTAVLAHQQLHGEFRLFATVFDFVCCCKISRLSSPDCSHILLSLYAAAFFGSFLFQHSFTNLLLLVRYNQNAYHDSAILLSFRGVA
ncbi:hypothetical protein RHSIM_Rhsim13G0049500 [Rhododendron simsii]|uniref:Uncharacterized protein n=1 Tax=Rhododendron simsii TaxID=118357 RepID=A0A834G396_RHOSS|nr:hypothetical protein RHSIM_Rhsim13G0049500 [Rhododendron simsii]